LLGSVDDGGGDARYAVEKVRRTVAGASRIPVEELRQEARLITVERHARWEAERIENPEGYARADRWQQLANVARAILRTEGFGEVEGVWQQLPRIADPERLGRSRATTARARHSLAEPIAADDTEADTISRLETDPTYDHADHDRTPYAEGRSRHWARTFRETFLSIAEEFLRVADRVKPATLSVPEHERRQEAARERLRVRYAAETAAVDAIEEGRDERLLRAMWGVA